MKTQMEVLVVSAFVTPRAPNTFFQKVFVPLKSSKSTFLEGIWSPRVRFFDVRWISSVFLLGFLGPVLDVELVNLWGFLGLLWCFVRFSIL